MASGRTGWLLAVVIAAAFIASALLAVPAEAGDSDSGPSTATEGALAGVEMLYDMYEYEGETTYYMLITSADFVEGATYLTSMKDADGSLVSMDFGDGWYFDMAIDSSILCVLEDALAPGDYTVAVATEAADVIYTGTFEVPAEDPSEDDPVEDDPSEDGPSETGTYVVRYIVDGRLWAASKYLPGDTVKMVPEPEKSGYRFVEWRIVDADVEVTYGTFDMPAEDLTVEGIFEKKVTHDEFDEEQRLQQERQKQYEQDLANALASKGLNKDDSKTIAVCAAAAVIVALLAVLVVAGRRD